MSKKFFCLVSVILGEKSTKWLIALLILSLAILVFVNTTAFAQVSGAIFTTNNDCNGVDLNIYKFKEDVYLDGGPRKPGSAGLPQGEYYVQVTSPSGILLGTTLGTNDETPVQVDESGQFLVCYQLCEILMIPNLATRGKGKNNHCGYADTPNPGGEYKVWICQYPDFPNSESKTDNFKVRKGKPIPPQTSIHVVKFYDTNANGIQNVGEPFISDWHIELRLKSDDTLIGCQLTDGGGEAAFLVNKDDTEYTVVEIPPEPGWYPLGDYSYTTPNSVLVIANQDVVEVTFGNVCLIENSADFDTKGYWHNKNGITELTHTPDVNFASVLSYVHSLDPYDSNTGYFSKGDEPFDGKFVDDSNVPAGKGVLGNEEIAEEGTVEAEISNFLIDSVGDGGIREQLAQQLLAFIFNAHYRIGDLNSMILPNGMPKTVEEVIQDAVGAWSSGNAVEQNVMAGLLDGFNNDDSVTFLIIPPEPCIFEPLLCP